MLIGVGWGGTNLEIVALTPDGGEPRPGDDELPGPTCWCGLSGCIETWVSGRACQAQYEAAAGERLHGSTTPIVKSKHGDSSGVRGAAWLWADA